MKYLTNRGSATVSIAGLLIAIMVLFSFGAAGSGALITKHKLNSATDLAALSAAMSSGDSISSAKKTSSLWMISATVVSSPISLTVRFRPTKT